MLGLLHTPDAALQPIAVGSLAAELVYHSLCESGTPNLLEVAQVTKIIVFRQGVTGDIICVFRDGCAVMGIF